MRSLVNSSARSRARRDITSRCDEFSISSNSSSFSARLSFGSTKTAASHQISRSESMSPRTRAQPDNAASNGVYPKGSERAGSAYTDATANQFHKSDSGSEPSQ